MEKKGNKTPGKPEVKILSDQEMQLISVDSAIKN